MASTKTKWWLSSTQRVKQATKPSGIQALRGEEKTHRFRRQYPYPGCTCKKVNDLLVSYADTVEFCAPSVAFADAERYLPGILAKRGIEQDDLPRNLDAIRALIEEIPPDVTDPVKEQALQRGQATWSQSTYTTTNATYSDHQNMPDIKLGYASNGIWGKLHVFS